MAAEQKSVQQQTNKLRILLSNDDGISAPGLAALYEIACELGEVTVVAPASHQSASGHCITLGRPLEVRSVHVDRHRLLRPFHGLSVDGKPADCVRVALHCLVQEPPNLVLSGINIGENVGWNVFYSGTVAVANEAAMQGVPAIACSLDAERATEEDFRTAAQHCLPVLRALIKRGLHKGEIVNVNVPHLKPGQRARGVKVVPLSLHGMSEVFIECDRQQAPMPVRPPPVAGEMPAEESRFYRIDTWRHMDPVDAAPDVNDVTALRAGYVSVTALGLDACAHRDLAKLHDACAPIDFGAADPELLSA